MLIAQKPVSAAEVWDIARFTAVSKGYGRDAAVIEDLNLSVRKGEFLTLLGPSGSGKTTTLMMLAGFEQPSSGSIEVNGRNVNGVPPYRRNIGVVFQNYALFPHMTVEENVAFPLRVRRNRSTAEIAQRVGEALELARMQGFAKRKPKELSGGQQQRVALARSMVFRPELILMDEPLGALDLKLRQEIQLELKSLHRSSDVTFVYVTHDQGEALTMSDRIAVFDRGRIQQLDDPRTLYTEPSNAFVAQFIGENNLVSGTVRAVNAGSCFVELAGATVEGPTASFLREGDKVRFAVRPENVAIEPAGRGSGLKGAVREVTYLGDQIRISITLSDGQEIAARLPADGIGSHPAHGESVIVSWYRDKCRVVESGRS